MMGVVPVVEHNDDGGDGDDDEDGLIDSFDPFRHPFYFDIILIKISSSLQSSS